MANTKFLKSSVGRKFAMALSALFLMIFLLQHFVINMMSVFSEDAFNATSHFMGTNPLIQFVMQPVLIFAVCYHFIMGVVLELQNRNARTTSYVKNNGAANSTWMSRNMIWTGLTILAFIGLHFIDFWLPEINHKYIEVLPSDPHRYFHELQHKFVNPLRVGAYVVAFVFLSLHLLHGFSSAFQSIGANNKYTVALKSFGKAYAIIIPAGFIFIALFHHFTH